MHHQGQLKSISRINTILINTHTHTHNKFMYITITFTVLEQRNQNKTGFHALFFMPVKTTTKIPVSDVKHLYINCVGYQHRFYSFFIADNTNCFLFYTYNSSMHG